jgi:hypothetical protein
VADLPAIPTRLANRPVAGGLVVPWISVESGDGRHLLGNIHRRRAQLCARDRLCQTCGQPLTRPAVAFVRQRDLDKGWTAEPAMHPECATYSAKACPMVNGTMSHHRRTPADVSTLTCQVDGCECGGWTNSPDQQHRAGAPAEPYYALWLRDLVTAVNPQGEVIGVGWQPDHVLRTRPVTPGAPEPVVPDRPLRDLEVG